MPRALLLLLLLAAVIRLALWFEYAATPLLGAPLFDSSVYVAQAQAVLHGHFGDPTLLAFSPLYGYFLAAVGAPACLWCPIAVQLGLGLLGTYLVFVMTRHRFGDTAALVAAALFIGYGQFVFYETKLLSETLGTTLALAAFALYLSGSFRGARWPVTLGAGALFGLATLARASLVFAVPLFVMAAALRWSKDGAAAGVRARRTVGLALGLALVFGANGFWTYGHAGVFVPVIYSGTDTSIMAHASGTRWTGRLDAVALDAGHAPNAWDRVRAVERALERRAEHGEPPARMDAGLSRIDPGALLVAAPSKLASGLGDIETGFQYSYYGERLVMPALAILPFTFGAIVLLGILGAVLLVQREGWRALLPYLPFVLGALAVVVLFNPSSRYRLPMVFSMLPLAGQAVVTVWQRARASRAWALAGVALAAMVVAFAVRTATYRLHHPARWNLTLAAAYAYEGDVGNVLHEVRLASGHGGLTPSERLRARAILRTVGRDLSDTRR